jgi:transketolase
MLADALAELGVENDFEQWQERRKEPVSTATIMPPQADYPEVHPGDPIVYTADEKTDCRSGYGNALLGLA